jgi:dienelactone hydrolase
VLAAATLVVLAHLHLLLGTPSPNPLAALPFVLVFAAALLAAGLLLLLVRLSRVVPGFFLWAAASAAIVVVYVLSMSEGLGKAALLLAIVVTIGVGALAGAGIATLARRPDPATGRGRKVAAAGLAAGLGLVGSASWWLTWEGPRERRPAVSQWSSGAAVRLGPDLADPSREGPYAVRELLYGTGDDRHWPEPGAPVSLRARTVDATAFVGGWDGLAGWARTRYWGFDRRRLPLRGRVYFPDGEGRFPLVLLVHGNHVAERPSDGGYAYLARLLASRGFIAVCVDENFLNFSFADLLGYPDVGLRRHHLARAFLLLEHLRLWREWNDEAGHPFHGRVDMDRVGLVGHSAGGEAVALACVLNRLRRHPEDARVALDFGFSIRGVVAIAPEVGVYRPGGRITEPEDVSYLVLQGSQDGMGFRGSRQYQRVHFTRDGGWFKAGVYVAGADHAQFNSAWGRLDLLGLENGFLDRRPFLSASAQQQVARVYVSAFLEAALKDARAYRTLFRAHPAAAWVPDVVCLHQYEDSSSRFLATYEEDVDAATATMPGALVSGRGLSYWREAPVALKWEPLDTRAVYLGWTARGSAEPARYAIELPPGEPGPGPEGELTFRLAQSEATGRPVDLTVELADQGGHEARLPLSHVALLLPRLETRFLKPPAGSGAPRTEAVFQDFSFPVADFAASGPGFDPRRLKSVALVFDRTESGSVVLDDVGWREGASPR